MTPYWVKFEGRASGCVECETEGEVLALATQLTGCKGRCPSTVLPAKGGA